MSSLPIYSVYYPPKPKFNPLSITRLNPLSIPNEKRLVLSQFSQPDSYKSFSFLRSRRAVDPFPDLNNYPAAAQVIGGPDVIRYAFLLNLGLQIGSVADHKLISYSGLGLLVHRAVICNGILRKTRLRADMQPGTGLFVLPALNKNQTQVGADVESGGSDSVNSTRANTDKLNLDPTETVKSLLRKINMLCLRTVFENQDFDVNKMMRLREKQMEALGIPEAKITEFLRKIKELQSH